MGDHLARGLRPHWGYGRRSGCPRRTGWQRKIYDPNQGGILVAGAPTRNGVWPIWKRVSRTQAIGRLYGSGAAEFLRLSKHDMAIAAENEAEPASGEADTRSSMEIFLPHMRAKKSAPMSRTAHNTCNHAKKSGPGGFRMINFLDSGTSLPRRSSTPGLPGRGDGYGRLEESAFAEAMRGGQQASCGSWRVRRRRARRFGVAAK